MGTSQRGAFRLMLLSATVAGVVLAAPVVAGAADPEPVEVPSPADLPDAMADGTIVGPETTEPLTIDLIIEEQPGDELLEAGPDAEDPEGAGDAEDPEGAGNADPAVPGPGAPFPVADPTTEVVTPSVTPAEPTSAELGVDDPASVEAVEVAAPGGPEGEEHTGEDGDHGSGEGHTGGGGQGTPYRMTFAVSWRSPDDAIIPALDDTLPAEWRTLFDLVATSTTGSGQPTTAHCTYPPGSDQLVCEFDNPGHGSDPEGMVVPAKPTATYTVTVRWPVIGWTIEGANAGPYSARDLCPREGDGHDGGHDKDHEVAALEGDGVSCVHVVVMRQEITEPPATEPPATEPPATEPPATAPPAETPAAVPPVTDPLPSEVPATAPPDEPPLPTAVQSEAAARSLPATGNTVLTTLMIGGFVLSLGASLALLSRRRPNPAAG